ncbi:RHS repeat protein, partial [Pseudomonas aeruginosa]
MRSYPSFPYSAKGRKNSSKRSERRNQIRDLPVACLRTLLSGKESMKIKKYTSSIRVYFFTIFFPAFIISPSANAELYQWWVFPYGEAGRGFPDPVSACEWVYSLISINWKKKMEPGKGSEKGKVLHCKYTGNGVYWEVISAVLRGSACPAGASLNN